MSGFVESCETSMEDMSRCLPHLDFLTFAQKSLPRLDGYCSSAIHWALATWAEQNLCEPHARAPEEIKRFSPTSAQKPVILEQIHEILFLYPADNNRMTPGKPECFKDLFVHFHSHNLPNWLRLIQHLKK